MLTTLCIALAALLGVAMEANGIFMLVAPETWYFAVPGVTATGPFNQHFVRDIGLIFLFIGSAMLFGIFRPALRVLLWGAAALWLAGHALFHLWEVAVGICAPSVIIQDFPAVTLPAIIATLLTLWAARQRAAT